MPISFEMVEPCVHIESINAHDVVSSQPQIFYIYYPYLFLHIYDPLEFYVW